MRNTVVSALILAGIAATLPTAASAQNYVDYQTKKPVIIYNVDAASNSGKFIGHLPTLAQNGTMSIRLYHVNTFRNKYTVKFGTTDFRTASRPSGANILLQVAKPSPVPLAGMNLHQELHTSNELLNTTYQEYQASVQSYAPLAANAIAKQAVLLPELITLVQLGSDNVVIRKNAVALVEQYLIDLNAIQEATAKPVLLSGFEVGDSRHEKDPDPNFTLMDYRSDDLISYLSKLNQLPQLDDLGAKYQAWKSAYAMALPSLSDSDKMAADRINTLVEKAQSKEVVEPNAVAKAIRYLFAIIIDTVQTPACIEKSVRDIRGDKSDEIAAEVDVDYTPLITAQVESGTGEGAGKISTRADSVVLKVYGKIALDYSTGIVVTSLVNKNYYGIPDPSSTAKTPPLLVEQGKADQGDVTAGFLANLYKTNASGTALGFCLGTSSGSTVRFANNSGFFGGINMRYLAGLSLIERMGRARLILSSGAAFGRVNTLGNGDTVGQRARSGSVVTNSVGETGQFVALTIGLSF